MLRGKPPPSLKRISFSICWFCISLEKKISFKIKGQCLATSGPLPAPQKGCHWDSGVAFARKLKTYKKYSTQALGVSWTSESRSYAATWIAWSWSQVICFELLFHIDPQLRLIQDNIQCETHWSCRLIQRDISRKASWWVEEIAIILRGILIQLLFVIKLYYDMTRPKTGKHIITGKTSIWW